MEPITEPYDTARVVKIGSSLYVRIPAVTCKRMEIIKGTQLDMFRDEAQIIYRKVTV